LARRQEDYQQAQLRVDTMGKSVEQVASEIEGMLRDVIRPEVEE